MIVAAVVIIAIVAVVAGRYLLSPSISAPSAPTSTSHGALPAAILGFSQNASQTQYATAAGLTEQSKALNDTMTASFITLYENATLQMVMGGLYFTNPYKAEAYALSYYQYQTTNYFPIDAANKTQIILWRGLNFSTNGWTRVYTYSNLMVNATLYDLVVVNGSMVCQMGLIPRAMNANTTAPKFYQNVQRAQAQTMLENASVYCFAAMHQ